MNIGRPVATSGQADLVRSGGISAIESLLTDGITPLIHEDDFIYKFLAGHPQHANNPRGYYFEDGRKSAELLKDIIETDTAVAPGVKFELLEFASGYGCVTRHLPLVMPLAQITACDIHEEAISFITEEIGQKAVPSCSDPKELELNSKFDIVFALSFFSHMPKATWEDWLVALFRHVRVGGSLIFTTHGKLTVERLYKNSISLPPEGFWFNPSSEQHDLDAAEYGTTIVSPEYVTRRIFQRLGGTLSFFSQGFWWNSQDLWVVTKLADWDVAALDRVLSKRSEKLAEMRRSTSREIALAAKNSELRRALHAVSSELREREQRLVNGDPVRQRLFDEILARERQLAAANADIQNREIRDRDRRLVAADADLRRLISNVEDRDRRLVAADSDLRRLTAAIQDRDQRLTAADAERQRYLQLEARLHSIESSTSWRIMTTLHRFVPGFLRKSPAVP